MAELKYQPVIHDHKAFLANARARKGFVDAYDALALEYQLAGQMLKARARAGLTQDAEAERMGTTKSAISRLESAGKHAPSLATLKRYASAVGCELQVRLVPHKVTRNPSLDQGQAHLQVRLGTSKIATASRARFALQCMTRTPRRQPDLQDMQRAC